MAHPFGTLDEHRCHDPRDIHHLLMVMVASESSHEFVHGGIVIAYHII
jgi:hypothetical protein